jgi:hypothetical protein
MVVGSPDLKAFLVATPFFGGLSDASLDLLVSMLVERRFDDQGIGDQGGVRKDAGCNSGDCNLAPRSRPALGQFEKQNDVRGDGSFSRVRTSRPRAQYVQRAGRADRSVP